MSGYRLSTEVFTLPYGDQVIVYAPLLSVVMVVDQVANNILADLYHGTFVQADADNAEFISTLMDLHLVNGPSGELHRDGDHKPPFAPREVTLFLTTACNLRCLYCYANGGESPRLMDATLACRAVDFVRDNARREQADHFVVGFHGGGEPTAAWDLLVQVVEYASSLASSATPKARFAIATNGVMPAEHAAWLAAHVHDINVSLDGLSEVQNRLRPHAAGVDSFAPVATTLDIFTAANLAFGVRMTVDRESLPHLEAAVRFLIERTSVRTIHAEPVFMCGRSLRSGMTLPDADAFCQEFLRLYPLLADKGVELYYSGARRNLVTDIFCKAAGEAMAITPEGDVTSCYEVCSRHDPRAATFFIGRYDTGCNRFVFDEDRLSALRRLTVSACPECSDCFCKYHCAGDCPAKRAYAQDTTRAYRCHINRTLTRAQIVRLLTSGSGTAQYALRERK